jgi:hypothetical protein
MISFLGGARENLGEGLRKIWLMSYFLLCCKGNRIFESSKEGKRERIKEKKGKMNKNADDRE